MLTKISERMGLGRRRRGEDGFTLIELLVVLAILGMLALIATPQVLKYLSRAKLSTAHTQVESLSSALDLYKLDVGRYPTTQEGLALLANPPADPDLRVRWRGPYLDSALPNDAWGHPYTYTYVGSGNPPFALYSAGDKSGSGGPLKGIGINPPG